MADLVSDGNATASPSAGGDKGSNHDLIDIQEVVPAEVAELDLYEKREKI